jgi:hypothetical protein
MNTKVTTLAVLVTSVLVSKRSGAGRPDKPATQRHSNATGDDVDRANICS